MAQWFPINTELFHFMRPQWLWLFVPLLIIVALTWYGGKSKSTWKKVIAPHLRPYMLSKGSRLAKLGPTIIYTLVLSILIIAIAGPTWKKIEVPGAKSEAMLLIALDLSPSMLAQDVSPDRLARAKFKIRDLLDANPGSKVGLMVFSGTAHPVVTPCTDYKLVAYQLESLKPQIMPVQGTNYQIMLQTADTILSRTEAPSTLLLVTDNIEPEQGDLLLDFVNSSKRRLEIITLATPQGAKVPGLKRGTYFKKNGTDFISSLNQNELFRLQKHEDINVNPLTLDKTDVEHIAAYVRENLEYQKLDEESEEDWIEMGFPLLWIALVFIALWFRKGWMIQWSVVLFFMTSCSSEISDWDDLWYTSDYQGQKAMEAGNYEEASTDFESLPNKGAAYYKAGNYEAAIEVFKQDSSAASLYNLGLAYAANGDHTAAAEALLLAQEMDPENEAISSAIKTNENVIQEIDSLARFNPDSAIVLEKKKKAEPLKERAAASEDEKLADETEAKELPKDGDRVTEESATEKRTAEEMESPPEDFQPQAGDDSQNVLLREISAEPSEFLRRRFKFQREKYYKNIKQPEELW